MSFINRNTAFPLVAGGILIIAGFVAAATTSGQDSTLDAQRAELATITAELDAAHSQTGALETEVSSEVAGVEVDRVVSDTEVIDDLLERALTWEDLATYREARESTMRVYSLAADSEFMTSFLPEAPVNIDSEGTEYSYIDAAGLNSRVADYTITPLSVEGLDYSYLVLADVQGKSSDGLGTAVNVAAIFVTIGENGTLTDVTGYASTSSPRTSG